MKVAWQRLIRFVSTDGRLLCGEPILPTPDFDLGNTTEETKLQARVIEGDDLYDTTGATRVTDEVVTVKTLLGPLVASDVSILRCVGLNYATHSESSFFIKAWNRRINTATVREAGRKTPPFPSIFFKPSTTIHDHGVNVVIPKVAQDDQADYEGELVVVIGKDAKNVKESDALDYVAAYTAGNDISSRKWQRDPSLAGGVPQWGFSKGFDTFAPLGPALVSISVITAPEKLHLQTIVDKDIRQDAGLDDLVFSIPRLIAHLSSGTTLQKGSVIMTGTPGGVGAGLQPPKYLVPGTQMEVKITQIGTLKNGVDFE
ncbi:fumarylacetoacetate hydralase [Fusarium agapanthi]|uniref:Fumarylacetoacetate hydralase n=1 Tax=Fusarium agapanthi TaxID=1803897 RepID=A0A9P5EI75_9HYPO|nr:fumarylacetoacetate hydralase [Fusarium agapanthi]